MVLWHLGSKRRSTGGRIKNKRKKKKFERGSVFLETRIGEKRTKIERKRSGNIKVRLLFAEKANVFDSKTKKIKSAKVLSVEENTANPHYVRRNVMTRGAVIKTDIGLARITSRPGQDGIINAVLIEENK